MRKSILFLSGLLLVLLTTVSCNSNNDEFTWIPQKGKTADPNLASALDSIFSDVNCLTFDSTMCTDDGCVTVINNLNDLHAICGGDVSIDFDFNHNCIVAGYANSPNVAQNNNISEIELTFCPQINEYNCKVTIVQPNEILLPAFCPVPFWKIYPKFYSSNIWVEVNFIHSAK